MLKFKFYYYWGIRVDEYEKNNVSEITLIGANYFNNNSL